MERSTAIKRGPLVRGWLGAAGCMHWSSAGWHCPQGHVLEICEDVARMGEDALGTEWAEASIPGDMPGDLECTRECCL